MLPFFLYAAIPGDIWPAQAVMACMQFTHTQLVNMYEKGWV